MGTGLLDKNRNEIKIGDTTRLVLDDGEVREFSVEFKTVKRTVKSHPDFDDEFANVNITGVDVILTFLLILDTWNCFNSL